MSYVRARARCRQGTGFFLPGFSPRGSSQQELAAGRGSVAGSRELPAGCSRPKAVLSGAEKKKKKRFLGGSERSPSSLGSPPAPREQLRTRSSIGDPSQDGPPVPSAPRASERGAAGAEVPLSARTQLQVHHSQLQQPRSPNGGARPYRPHPTPNANRAEFTGSGDTRITPYSALKWQEKKK